LTIQNLGIPSSITATLESMHKEVGMRRVLGAVSVVVMCLWVSAALAGDKKVEGPAKGDKGAATGVIAKMDGGKITLKVGEKETVFMPYWKGGAPKDGGGFDKDMMKTLSQFKVGDKVKISWTMEEHQRIDTIEKAE
jgi:hypothetical protein